MPETFTMKLDAIQPSQLYINAAKLATVRMHLDPFRPSSYRAVPVKQLGEEVIYTDGHTRAFTVYVKGGNHVKAYWEHETLNWRMYRVCVAWCKEVGITTIGDLEGRVISPAKFEKRWIQRCHSHEAYDSSSRS